MTQVWSQIFLCGAAVAIAAPASAQTGLGANQSMFARNRNVGVSERAHAEYDPVPIPLGAFTALPVLSAGVEFNDNIYASNDNKRGDTVLGVVSEIGVGSRWSRNAVNVFARADSRSYSRNSAENTVDLEGGGGGRLDVGRFGAITSGGDLGLLHEQRGAPTAPTNASKPIEYTAANVFIGAQQEFNRLRTTGRFDYQDLDYRNAVSQSGAQILQDDRDHSVSTVSGKAEYALSPAIAVFGAGSYNDHHYRLTPPSVPQNRNSTGSEFDVGASFDLTSLSRGTAQIGYQDQRYDGGFGHVTGLSASGKIEWFPTQLTTITLNGTRGFQDAAAVGASAYIAESVGLQADYELLRNLVLSGRVGYESDAYRVIDRTDKQTSTLISARYRMNRLVNLTASYNHLALTSSGAEAGGRFSDNRVLLSLSLQF